MERECVSNKEKGVGLKNQQSNIKVSVVIPVYNAEKYIRQCLDSILNQTLKEIEVICVDDLSTDSTVEILREYEANYSNVTAIYHKENYSAAKCRKDGVLASSGEYVVFSDADDFFELDALETAYNKIKEKKVDMLHFGTTVENCANLPKARIDMNAKLVAPYLKNDVSSNILEECFLNKKFAFNVWGKMIKGDVCREAVENATDGFFPKANDLYIAFLIFDKLTSYYAIDKKLYHYCFGRGQTGHNTLDTAAFELCCKSAAVYFELEKYAKEQNNFERYEKVLARIKDNLMTEQVNKWFTMLDYSSKSVGFDYMITAWKNYNVDCISKIAERFWYERADIAKYVKNSEVLEFTKREIKTIALYYRNIVNGGAQRVVAEMCGILSEKFKVILVTDEEATPDDYELPANVKRFVIPDRELHKQKAYLERGKALNRLVEEEHIDLFINSMWVEPGTFYDKLVIKSHPTHPAYITHCHNFFAMLFRRDDEMAKQLWHGFSIDDALVVLSSCDEKYWKNINPNARFIRNPNTFTKGTTTRNKKNGKYLLYVNRLSSEKRPLEAIKIMSLVTQRHPDAVLHIVGSGDDNYTKKCHEEVKKLGLTDNVVFEGFTTDVRSFYEKADLFLYTSEYEGYPLTLFEAAAFGIPTVMYDLSFLEYYRLIEGYDSVPQLDAKASADCVCKLLDDDELWEKKSNQIFDSYCKLEDISILECWEKMFSKISNPSPKAKKEERNDLTMILQKINDFAALKTERINQLKKDLAKEKNVRLADLNHLQEELNQEKLNRNKDKELLEKFNYLNMDFEKAIRYIDEIKDSTSWKVGRFITWIPRHLKNRIKKLGNKKNM